MKMPKQWDTFIWRDQGIVRVEMYGAKFDGVADDTAAINEAIQDLPSTGGIVQMPPRTAKITGPIMLRSNVRLEGMQMAVWPATEGTILDASSITDAGVRVIDLANASNAALTRFQLRCATTQGAPPGLGLTGIGGAAEHLLIDTVYVEAANDGIWLDHCNGVRLVNVWSNDAVCRALALDTCNSVHVLGGQFQNAGRFNDTNSGNIYMNGGTDSVLLQMTMIDEARFATVNIRHASNVVMVGTRLYMTKDVGQGPGYGFRLDGNGAPHPTNVTLIGWHVGPFDGAGQSTQTIALKGSGHKLIGVTTNPNGGGDILDEAIGTAFVASTLPTVNVI